MRLYLHECGKLFRSLAVWGFVVLCMALNLFLVWSSSGDSYSGWVSATAHETGVALSGDYHRTLSRINAPPERSQLQAQLQAETAAPVDIFDDYSTQYIAEIYSKVGKLTPVWAEKVNGKYDALQQVVNHKGARDESLSLYFASSTYSMHQQLFNQLPGWLITESSLLMALLVFLSVGYETIHQTESIVCSTRTGRRVTLFKLLAALSAGFFLYALLSALTYGFFFHIHDYGSIWQSHVSSLFNYRADVLTGPRPFITWGSFTVWTYFLAVLSVSMGLILCFALLAFIISLLLRHLYFNFFIFLAANACLIVLPYYIPSTWSSGLFVKFYVIFTPVWLWLKRSLWFTDGDIDIMWSYFEVKGVLISLFTLLVLCLLTAAHYKRRDLT